MDSYNFMKRYKKILSLFFSLWALTMAQPTFSAPKSELRGVWIATVANIDWPSTRGNTERQKQEMILMLDSLRANNINAILFQARPSADAFYQSDLEPWSAYLTGEQGKAPSPFYDPLAFVIEEAHKRCIEVHVWINPYRVTNGESTKNLASNHIYRQRPDLFKMYGGKCLFDPGKQETMDYLVKVIRDMVSRYDMDAIHFDDYFYPYKVQGQDFPDTETFQRENRGVYDRKAWRINNVNMIVERLHKEIKTLKPWVDFGISPFGVWRNGYDDFRGSESKAGCTNYDELSADVLHWLEMGWIDYVAPQLYWEIGKNGVDYEVLASWWSQYSFGRKLYVGLYASGLEINKGAAWKKPNELMRQLRYNRECDEVSGAIFYSARYFLKNAQGLKDSLRGDFYKYPAIVPASSEVAEPSQAPAEVNFERYADADLLTWEAVEGKGGQAISYYVVYAFDGNELGDFSDPKNILLTTPETQADLTAFERLHNGTHTIVVTSVNRFRKESGPSAKILLE